MAKLNRINLPHGCLKILASEAQIDRNKASRYMSGLVDEYSKDYEEALRVRAIAKNLFKL